jgi:hypothetical protein
MPYFLRAHTHNLPVPRYVGSSALQQLGGGFQAAGEVLQHFAEVWTEELEAAHLNPSKSYAEGNPQAAADEERKLGLLRLEKGSLQKRIAAPLGTVICSLEQIIAMLLHLQSSYIWDGGLQLDP